MAYTSKIKLTARILLPPIVWGISWCVYSFVEHLLYGSFEQMYKNGLIDDSSERATYFFMSFVYFIILPIAYLFHALFCLLNDKYNFINMRSAIIIGIIIVASSAFFLWSANMEHNIKGLIEFIFLVFPALLLYVYGLNLTKIKKEEN